LISKISVYLSVNIIIIINIGLNKPENNLYNGDIEHALPDCVKFKTKRTHDPQNPTYQLPKVEIRPVTPPRFIRDNLTNQDIDGSMPRQPVYYETRENILRIDDIAGSQPRDRTFKRSAQFDAINYRDVTHSDFRSKRSTNPLDPEYIVKNNDGSTEVIGRIVNSSGVRFAERKRGPVNSSLDTSDIAGAKTGTKNLGVFANHSRTNFRKTNEIHDIAGSTVGSLKKGVSTKRISNPLNPDYPVPGQTEYNNNAFGNTGQQIMNGSKATSQVTQQIKSQPKGKMPHNINKEYFKRDVNQFYGSDDRNFADIDYNKLYKATKDPVVGHQAPPIPEQARRDVDFKRNEKKFWNQSQNEGSEYEYNQNKFYGDQMKASMKPGVPEDVQRDVAYKHNKTNFFLQSESDNNELDYNKNQFYGSTSQNKQSKQIAFDPIHHEQPNPNSQHYKKDMANFHGQTYVPSDKGSDRGSIFQNNAAEFYGAEKPAHGEKPFRISENNLQDPNKQLQNAVGSVLNERRLKEHEKNMQRDPRFGKNERKFFGLKSQPTNSAYSSSNRSYAQKLDGLMRN
jgi:hypothetical protein